jgi:hypothetical protein
LDFIRVLKFPGRPALPEHLEMVTIITNEKTALKKLKQHKSHVSAVWSEANLKIASDFCKVIKTSQEFGYI